MMVDGFLLGVNVQLQSSHAQSSGESEFCAIGAGCADGLYAHGIMRELGINLSARLRSDASAAQAAALRQGLTRRMRHVDVKYLYIQNLINDKKVVMGKISTDLNISDLGTKYLRAPRLEFLKGLIGKAHEINKSSGGQGTDEHKNEYTINSIEKGIDNENM